MALLAFKAINNRLEAPIYLANFNILKILSKRKALKAAKEKANDYAKAINQTIGKALFIQELSTNNINSLNGNANGIMIRGYSSAYGARSKEYKIQDLNIKSITITASVMAKFSLN